MYEKIYDEFLSSLSRDLSMLLVDTEDYNMIINVGEKDNTKTFRVHSIILRVRSPYFRTALSNEWAKIENNLITFNKPNIRPIIFEVILRYIYTGQIILDDYETSIILELLVAADELCLQELMDHVQDYLIGVKADWMQKNYATIHRIAFQHSCAFKKLKKYCLDVMRYEPELVFQAEDFSLLDENSLINLLRRDDLLIDEVILWEHVIKWGIYNAWITIQQPPPPPSPSSDNKQQREQREDHLLRYSSSPANSISSLSSSTSSFSSYTSNTLSTLSTFSFSSFKTNPTFASYLPIISTPIKDLSQWTSREFQILGASIEKCIPFIRFLQISSGDFYKKVKPFSTILPIELYEEILQYHLVPGHQPDFELIQPKREAIDSLVIERKHAAIIASWIDGCDLRGNCNSDYDISSRGSSFNSLRSLDDEGFCGEEETEFYEPWNNPYEFKLLLRGSKNGFTGTEFHARCDSQAATVTVLKVHGTGEIIGGFTPIHWLSQNTWGYTENSFIFCLDSNNPDSGDVKNNGSSRNIVSRVREATRAINYYANYGPSFGRDDLKMAGDFKLDSRCCCKQGDYEFSIRESTDNFSVDEYEVFQVLPRKRFVENCSINSNSNSININHNSYYNNEIDYNSNRNNIYDYNGGGGMTRSLTY